ncbi:oncostatin-M-specific receptor subunit beta isoform X1 [Alligator mississippiensis]|nr:oncostatin-M-specific receptor subunit beta isoform X1 [Alligator mississippiensis]XP_059581195.1 oncostatin-M-specific receptor subunit beta isoform X1 [Alligator mississippiensis]
MMNHFELQTLLLCVTACFCIYHTKESRVFPVTFLNVSKNSTLQRLLVEWDVSDSAHESEQEMVFEIQVSQTEEKNVVWIEYYNTTLSKLTKPLFWSWDSELPLECASHSVRIRSKVAEVWSPWSSWETVLGLDTSDADKPLIFPEDKVVQEGSNFTFCCIGGKNQKVEKIMINTRSLDSTPKRTIVRTINEVSLGAAGGQAILCTFNGSGYEKYIGTLFHVGRLPDEPKNVSCETRDMKTAKCTWNSGNNVYICGKYLAQYKLFDWFSQKTLCSEIQVSRSEEWCVCSWDIHQQMTYNFTLTAENKLGKKSVNFNFDVAHRVYPFQPSDFWEEYVSASQVKLYWTMEPRDKAIELICQIEDNHPDGKVEWHNSSVVHSNTYANIMISGLQPYTIHKFQIRCGAAKHFWKWSEWSKDLTITTKEAAPSGKLDLWRDITPVMGGRNVTLFWKQLPGFQANGRNISYEITWENLEEATEPEHISISAPHNSTRICIGYHSYRISITAKNHINSSSPSEIIISGATDNDAEEKINGTDKEERVEGTDHGIWIHWQPRNTFDGYIVDWCNFPNSQPCDFQWKRSGFNTSGVLIDAVAFVPGVRYHFRVFGSVANKASLLEKKAGYSKELPPSDPDVKIIGLIPYSVSLAWDSYRTDGTQPGFIRGYNIYVKSLPGCNLKGSTKYMAPDGLVWCKYTIKNPEEKRFIVEHLVPNTAYQLAVKAVTGGGETPITQTLNINALDDSNKIYLPLVLGIIPFVLITAICFWKHKWVKDYCSQIPSPDRKVLSFDGFKVASETELKVSDCIPDAVTLESKSEAKKLDLWSQRSMLEERKTAITDSSWLPLVPNEDRDFTCSSSDSEAGIWHLKNPVYSSSAAHDSMPYQNLHMLHTSEPQPLPLLYQPQHDIEIMNKDTVVSRRETMIGDTSLVYISQMDVPCSGTRLNDLYCSTEPGECLGYNLSSDLVTSISDGDLEQYSPTSTSTTGTLLPD